MVCSLGLRPDSNKQPASDGNNNVPAPTCELRPYNGNLIWVSPLPQHWDKDSKLISQLDSFWLIMGTRNLPALARGFQSKDRIVYANKITNIFNMTLRWVGSTTNNNWSQKYSLHIMFVLNWINIFILYPPFSSLRNKPGPSARVWAAAGLMAQTALLWYLDHH